MYTDYEFPITRSYCSYSSSINHRIIVDHSSSIIVVDHSRRSLSSITLVDHSSINHRRSPIIVDHQSSLSSITLVDHSSITRQSLVDQSSSITNRRRSLSSITRRSIIVDHQSSSIIVVDPSPRSLSSIHQPVALNLLRAGPRVGRVG